MQKTKITYYIINSDDQKQLLGYSIKYYFGRLVKVIDDKIMVLSDSKSDFEKHVKSLSEHGIANILSSESKNDFEKSVKTISEDKLNNIRQTLIEKLNSTLNLDLNPKDAELKFESASRFPDISPNSDVYLVLSIYDHSDIQIYSKDLFSTRKVD